MENRGNNITKYWPRHESCIIKHETIVCTVFTKANAFCSMLYMPYSLSLCNRNYYITICSISFVVSSACFQLSASPYLLKHRIAFTFTPLIDCYILRELKQALHPLARQIKLVIKCHNSRMSRCVTNIIST